EVTIGELARRARVNVQTVRYYERRGLLAEPPRRDSGYRDYDEGTLDRLRFIRRAQELGFTLTEIGELLAIRLDPETTAADVKGRATRKIEEIDAKLRDLERIRHALSHLAGQCRGGHGPTGDCPLLEELGALRESEVMASAAASNGHLSAPTSHTRRAR
ncbi:MAG: MerR family transcriptional regulator, partial [Gemmatimonadaceae bacterium]